MLTTLDKIVVKRPSYNVCKTKQNLCLDKGYDFQEIKDSVIKKGFLPHTRHKGEQSTTKWDRLLAEQKDKEAYGNIKTIRSELGREIT